MEIGLFQLENLVVSRIAFLLFDLRTDRSRTLPVEISKCLKGSIAIQSDKVQDFLNQQKHPKSAPFVLLCDEGRVSRNLAHDLEKVGYENVYVVSDGVEGLLSDLV